MANIGELRRARLAWEWLQAIKNFLPVRDSVREKLQARQEAQVEFTTGTTELFKPVTTATEKAAMVTKEALLGDPTDVTKPGILPMLTQHGRIMGDISAGLQPPPPPGAEAVASQPSFKVKKTAAPVARVIVPPSEKFTQEFVKFLKNVPEDQLAKMVVNGWERKDQSLKAKYVSMGKDDFLKYAYRICYNKTQATGKHYSKLWEM